MALLYLLSRVLGALVGLGLGLCVLLFASAWAGIPIGILLGFALGYVFGLLPPELVRHGIQLSLRWTESTRLKERLNREPGLALFIIEELVRRGESVEQFREPVAWLLKSNSFVQRRSGKECIKRWFPNWTP